MWDEIMKKREEVKNEFNSNPKSSHATYNSSFWTKTSDYEQEQKNVYQMHKRSVVCFTF